MNAGWRQGSDATDATSRVHLQLVCQFGEPTRGISPYGDALSAALMAQPGINIEAVDYKSAYPDIFHPARAGHHHGAGKLAWYNPVSWYRVATGPGEVMHLQHWAPQLASYLWPLAQLAKRSGKKVIVTVHNPLPHEKTGLFDFAERGMLLGADAIIVHGEAGGAALHERLGEHCPPVFSIPHGVEVGREPMVAAPADFRNLGLDPAMRHVLLFGNLRPYKGVSILLEAWRLAQQAVPGVRLVIAGQLWSGKRRRLARVASRVLGTNSQAADMEQCLARENLPDGVVVREGFLGNDEIDALIRASDLVVFPYMRFSGQSGAACRAAAMGKPVLVSKTGSLPDLAIDESWVVKPGDEYGLAARLVEKMTAPAALVAAGSRQLEKIEGYGWAAVAQTHAALYRRLV